MQMFLSASGGSDIGTSQGRAVGARSRRTGDLDELLNDRPVFRLKLNGYDRLEVDNYAAWAEAELTTLRRRADHLLARFDACSAELEISRRLLADAPRGREVYPVTARVEEMLRLASEEAAAMTEAGAAAAAHLVDEARAEADARLRKAHEITETAVRSADELLEHVRGDRAAAAAELARAREEAAAIRRQAAGERDRMAVEAAGIRTQRDDARESLRRLGDRVGEALRAVVGPLPEDIPVGAARTGRGPGRDVGVGTVLVDNIVADPPPDEGAHEGVAGDGASAGLRAEGGPNRSLPEPVAVRAPVGRLPAMVRGFP
jgi:cell division septum initiation protein DivIVA